MTLHIENNNERSIIFLRIGWKIMESTERLSKAKEIKSLEELKSIELNIMKKIHHFCEKNDIVYYLSFGTLIGAVRHDGFIPWEYDENRL